MSATNFFDKRNLAPKYGEGILGHLAFRDSVRLRDGGIDAGRKRKMPPRGGILVTEFDRRCQIPTPNSPVCSPALA
jgi:hypothetical protein